MANDRSAAHFRSQETRFSYRWPLLSAIRTQVIFWVVANTVLVTVSHLVIRAVAVTYTEIQPPPFLPVWALSVATAVCYGTALGVIDIQVDRRLSPATMLGTRILIKTTSYTLAFVCISVMTLAAFDLLMSEWFKRMGLEMDHEARFRWGLTFVPTTLVGNLLISFIKQVNRSFGPGLLISLLTGRYREPVLERRIFMFMDLKASTTHAEELGPSRYSSMIRDLFHELDPLVLRYEAEIYQYIGDEVVFTWNEHELSDKARCLSFYYAIEGAIKERGEYYIATYGRSPTFKAGLHVGDVIAVEVGDIKREIAYHGDTINTAARIQNMCNEFGRRLVVSEELMRQCALDEASGLRAEALGGVMLRGKQAHVVIYAIEPVAQGEERAAPPLPGRMNQQVEIP